MTQSPSGATAPLPSRPSLALLSNLAKQLRKAHAARDPAALARFKGHHPRFKTWSADAIAGVELSLRDAQVVIAREYGFDNWAALKQHVLSLHEKSAGEAAVAALMDSSERGDVEKVARLLDDHPQLVDARGADSHKQTALHKAAWKGHQAVVEMLLDRGADPTVQDVGDNATPLHFAAEQGFLPIVKLLVSHGADPNGFGDIHGLDVLGWATCVGRVNRDVAGYLIQSGARHNIFSAVAMGDEQAIRELASISRDAMDKPMAIWEERRRPLHLAVIKKQPKVIPVLLDLGAEIEATNIDDLTPLDQAALRGETEGARILLERGAKIGVPAAFGLGREDHIERVLAADPDVVQPGERWGRLLHLASSAAPADVIERLIRAGASVHARTDSRSFGTKSYTPLHEAAWGGNLGAIKVLVKHGARLDAQDGSYDGTPLGWAKYNGKIQAAELLQSLGGR